jgi:hypothetical protein
MLAKDLIDIFDLKTDDKMALRCAALATPLGTAPSFIVIRYEAAVSHFL